MLQKTRKGNKTEDRWLGPYVIVELSKTSCLLAWQGPQAAYKLVPAEAIPCRWVKSTNSADTPPTSPQPTSPPTSPQPTSPHIPSHQSSVDIPSHQSSADIPSHQSSADIPSHQSSADIPSHQSSADTTTS